MTVSFWTSLVSSSRLSVFWTIISLYYLHDLTTYFLKIFLFITLRQRPTTTSALWLFTELSTVQNFVEREVEWMVRCGPSLILCALHNTLIYLKKSKPDSYFLCSFVFHFKYLNLVIDYQPTQWLPLCLMMPFRSHTTGSSARTPNRYRCSQMFHSRSQLLSHYSDSCISGISATAGFLWPERIHQSVVEDLTLQTTCTSNASYGLGTQARPEHWQSLPLMASSLCSKRWAP